MPERWRDALDRLGRVGPDQEKIRALAAHGPRLPEPAPGRGRRIGAGVVALAVAIASFAFVVSMFRGGPDDVTATRSARPSSSPSGPPAKGALDPVAICDVPAFDPDVALLVGSETHEYSLEILEAPGEPGSSLEAPGADALREYLASPDARHAPADGWRVIATSPGAVLFAAPHDPAEARWWIVGFEDEGGLWRRVETEIVEQQPTPAQRGHGLDLRWDGELVLEDGTWNAPLRLVNGQASAWVDSGEFLAEAHTFDPATEQEIGPGAPAIIGTGWEAHELPPSGQATIPLALGGNVDSLRPGNYDVVACVPSLGLASPVSSLRVEDDATVPEVRVLAHHPGSAYPAALAFGAITVKNGCVAIQGGGQSTYVVWPEGFTLVHRGDRTVLIDPTGREVGALGDEVSLGGGYIPFRHIADMVIGGIPDECRTGGEGYFITSGPA